MYTTLPCITWEQNASCDSTSIPCWFPCTIWKSDICSIGRRYKSALVSLKQHIEIAGNFNFMKWHILYVDGLRGRLMNLTNYMTDWMHVLWEGIRGEFQRFLFRMQYFPNHVFEERIQLFSVSLLSIIRQVWVRIKPFPEQCPEAAYKHSNVKDLF